MTVSIVEKPGYELGICSEKALSFPWVTWTHESCAQSGGEGVDELPQTFARLHSHPVHNFYTG